MRAYERQPGESDTAFAAYKLYRNLGPGRTLREMAAVFYHQPEYRASTKRVPGRVKSWSATFEWADRAREADARDDRIRREAVELYSLDRLAERSSRVEDLRDLNLRNEEKAAELETKFLERAERQLAELPLAATKNPVADAARLHKISTRSEPTKVDMRNYDLTSATDEQLGRIVAGEDPARVLGDGC